MADIQRIRTQFLADYDDGPIQFKAGDIFALAESYARSLPSERVKLLGTPIGDEPAWGGGASAAVTADSLADTLEDAATTDPASLVRISASVSEAAATSAEIAEKLAALNTGALEITGGRVSVKTGEFEMDSPLVIDSGSAENIRNVALSGNLTGTKIDFQNAPAGSSGVDLAAGSVFVRVADLMIRNAPDAGIRLRSMGEDLWNHCDLSSVRLSGNANGVHADEGFMGSFRKVFAAGNSSNGFRFGGPHTSLHFDNSYADHNLGHGFSVTRPVYSAFTACGSDFNTESGYRFTGASQVCVTATGAENNGRAGWSFDGAPAQPGFAGPKLVNILQGCLAFANNQAGLGYPNLVHVTSSGGVSNTVIARGCQSSEPANGGLDAIVDGEGAVLVNEYNTLPAGVLAKNRGYIYTVNLPVVVRDKAVTGPTPIVSLKNSQGIGTGAFGAVINILAASADPSTDGPRNTTMYSMLVNFGAWGTVVPIAAAGLTAGDGSNHPSFSWSLDSTNNLVATPVGSTSGVFFFEVLADGFCAMSAAT